jgi:hypothetical protein
VTQVALLADAFLSRITEDETGLWELEDESRTALPEVGDDERREMAAGAMEMLLMRGLVAARRGEPFHAGVELARDAAISALSDPGIWERPTMGSSLTLMLDATPEGRGFYFGGHKLAQSSS